ncbi:RelA/SpoT family protein [Candidatus Marinarcus aquaticus]|uniref:Bifunctional (P)ppGpp synthase/hydrolase n=1 Tax=Candidatus Marinarcus aquaticus TaxID=2044504 RepID=A0A4Q0XT22_9BACT|nr:RelA/SpoT family protein [Candidatus Marinarcus aquaticus]RXJ60640.1 bifunctional (p)ppGpp synthase/hydrolase [Candidatus Marinarcus aquaticus]
MDPFLKKIEKINTIEKALEELKSEITFSDKLQEILNFCIKAHEGQYRKSGEPYIVHPILVAAVTAHFNKEESVVATALLHDIVEDTSCSLDYIKRQWGEDIAHMVDGLTKIVEIREHELAPSDSTNTRLISSALTFRKMLIASIDDVRVLIVKLCDRLHNMLTLQALPKEKQLRIAEETLVVYVPIAHRLGISAIKNALEDLCFFYIYPNEYEKIDTFIKTHQHKIQLTFNKFISNTMDLLEKNGFDPSKIQILSRIKHYYSIYMKIQRKGVNIDEVLDLLAIRILVEDEIDCYKVLGLMHLEYKPLIARFKDYVATPKENGYQTIHTTVFYNSKIYEVQIRTFNMHKVAEYGIAAHWKYKSGVSQSPNLNWLKSLEFSNKNIEEFYSETKQDLFSEDIVVYSPKGDTYTLPRGATAYDYAFAVHTDVGNKAVECYINKVKKPLLTQLQSSDIVAIHTAEQTIPRCSWIDMVKTSRAKKHIKLLCSHRQKEINELSGKNIIDTIFSRYTNEITEQFPQKLLHKIPTTIDYLKHVKRKIETNISKTKSFVARLTLSKRKIKEYKFDNILIYSNFSINSVLFEHCCHPKFGDEIVAFKEGNKAIIHHQMCDKAYAKIKTHHPMLFCSWTQDTVYQYKMVVSLPKTRGELAKLLSYMAQYEIYILGVEYGREKHSYVQFCDIEFEINNGNLEEVKKLIQRKVKVMDFFSKKDAYK